MIIKVPVLKWQRDATRDRSVLMPDGDMLLNCRYMIQATSMNNLDATSMEFSYGEGIRVFVTSHTLAQVYAAIDRSTSL